VQEILLIGRQLGDDLLGEEFEPGGTGGPETVQCCLDLYRRNAGQELEEDLQPRRPALGGRNDGLGQG